MCGLAGIYNPNGVSIDSLKKMSDAISHRGPDAEGFFTHENFGIAHRRLSIIDLSDAANQPMLSLCGRYHMVFNGEIYNFKDVASDLGVSLKTKGDTEVILEAFAKWGPSMVNRLNGMFTIAIVDTKENRLFLFRDRMGIKPLYVYRSNGMLAFASELKAIVALEEEVNLTVNQSAIPYFLHLGYIPEPLSIYNEVEKFPSGNEFAQLIPLIEKLLTKPVSAILCAEAGGLNSTIPFVAASKLGLPIIDGDAMGRAFPELQMVTFTLGGISATPMAMVDEKGNGCTYVIYPSIV